MTVSIALSYYTKGYRAVGVGVVGGVVGGGGGGGGAGRGGGGLGMGTRLKLSNVAKT